MQVYDNKQFKKEGQISPKIPIRKEANTVCVGNLWFFSLL